MYVLQTARLELRALTDADAEFIFGLVNQPSWLEFIGDRGVRTLDDARAYINNGPVASYAANGFGLWLVVLRDAHTPIGMCGLIKRDTLDHPDIGYAFIPDYWGKGYAFEAASGVMAHAKNSLALPRVLAITAPNNARSIRVLEKLGLRLEQTLRPGAHDEVSVYGVEC